MIFSAIYFSHHVMLFTLCDIKKRCYSFLCIYYMLYIWYVHSMHSHIISLWVLYNDILVCTPMRGVAFILIYIRPIGHYYICHRHEIQVKEKTKRFGCIYSNWGFQHGCQQMCRLTMAFPVHMHSGFPTGRSKQMIVTSWNDVTVISHAILGGNYKRRAHSNLGAVVWVFGYWTVRYIDKSQTLYYGYLVASHGA